jgi:ABC-type Na+ efflux pump permease subunit
MARPNSQPCASEQPKSASALRICSDSTPSAVIAGNSGGVLMEVLTWVPIWTPFAVLARLGLGIPTWEVIGSGITLAAFAAAEVVLLGRLFRASLLASGQRPNLREVVARMRAVQS